MVEDILGSLEWSFVLPSYCPISEDAVEFASDASGTWGCGAWCDTEWWQFEWPRDLQRDIAFKELFAVVLAVAAWGSQWRGIRVLGRCDNEAVTAVLRSRSSRDPHLMHLLRCLFFIEAEHCLSVILQGWTMI